MPAYLISICGGMHLAYGIYNLTLGLELWMVDFEIAAIAMVPITFHIMTIIGGTIGAFVYDKTHISKLQVRVNLIIETHKKIQKSFSVPHRSSNDSRLNNLHDTSNQLLRNHRHSHFGRLCLRLLLLNLHNVRFRNLIASHSSSKPFSSSLLHHLRNVFARFTHDKWNFLSHGIDQHRPYHDCDAIELLQDPPIASVSHAEELQGHY
jgi:hypothetical protein